VSYIYIRQEKVESPVTMIDDYNSILCGMYDSIFRVMFNIFQKPIVLFLIYTNESYTSIPPKRVNGNAKVI
jgi:hypothetical protein